MNAPKRIIVEYEDGSRREALFEGLTERSIAELSSLGLLDAPPSGTSKNYVLLNWKDGWKEVMAVDGDAVEVLRYYTIERVEEIGRLSFGAANGNPKLKLVKRLPGSVESILFVGKDGPKAYLTEEKVTVREGGKIEHFYYDKKKPDFTMEGEPAARARYSKTQVALKTELDKKGISVESLLGMG